MWESFTTSYVNVEYLLSQINFKLFYFRKAGVKWTFHSATDFENFPPPHPSHK